MSDAPAVDIRRPWDALHAYGQVLDQRTSGPVPYRADAITTRMQTDVLSFLTEPPRMASGQTVFLSVLKARQTGCSVVTELGCYVKTAYNPGWKHYCIADKQSRADDLHSKVHFTHSQWPGPLQQEGSSALERKQITFDPSKGGSMRTLSAERPDVGIGLSPDSFHASEIAFWSDAEETWGYAAPSVINRDQALVVFECTPAPSDAPSVEFWRETYQDGRRGRGRFRSVFYPMWDGLLNRRPWPDGQPPDLEELRLLDKYGAKGLTLENLAFRREMMETSPQIRRNPSLFGVFYPFDDLTCWVGASAGVLRADLLLRHSINADHEWTGPYHEYEPPEAGALYVMGVDPSGWGRDDAAFHVLKVWDGEWTQVASFAEKSDPIGFANACDRAGRRYNNALIVGESTGVGQGWGAMMIERGYPNLFYNAPGKPGLPASAQSNERLLGHLADALRTELVLNDKDTVAQMQSYRHDKLIEEPLRLEILRGEGRRRRPKHHWDKVSAMMLAVQAARMVPQRSKLQAGQVPRELPLGWYRLDEDHDGRQRGPAPVRAALRGRR